MVAIAFGGSASAAVAPPDQWGFEQVTPADKGGGNVQAVDSFQARADGGAFLLSASAPFDGVPAESAPLYTRYLAERAPSEWSNRAVDVPFDPIPPARNSALVTVAGTSDNLAFALVASTRALAPGATPGGGNLYMRNTATGAYALVATHPSQQLTQAFVTAQAGTQVKYISPDGKAAVFFSPVALVAGAPEEPSTVTLYRWTASRGIELVSKLPDSEGGEPVFSWTAVGYINEDATRQSLPPSGGADNIYFSSLVASNPGPAYRWNDGDVSVISKSQISGDESPAVPANVLATTPNADFALIQTLAPDRLTSDAPNFDAGTPEEGTGRVLYRYSRASGSLEYVGVADYDTFSPAEQMSADGRTIVFKTLQQLTPDAAEYFGSGDPRNRRNLYVWRDGTLRFVTSFDPGARSNGGNWLRLLSESGRYLAFVDSSQGTASRFGVTDNTSVKCAPPGIEDPAPCDQVYVFDTHQAGSLECASCRPGAQPQGQSGDPGIAGTGMMLMNGRQVQTVADDGTAFFTSSEDLVADDSNGLQDVYAYRAGRLRLVSGGVQGASARFLDATPDGSSIFFSTNAQLAETDTDRAVDVYVTRLGAGFPYERPFEQPPCTGSTCRDGAPGPGPGAGVLDGGSGSNSGAPPAGATSTKPRVRLMRVERRKGSLRVTVRTNGTGQVRVSGKQVRPTTRSARRAGDLTFSVPLSKKSRATIREKGRLRARIRVSLSPPFGKSAASTSTRTVR